MSNTSEFQPVGDFCIKRTAIKEGRTKVKHVSPGAFGHCEAIATAAMSEYPSRFWVTSRVENTFYIVGANGTQITFEIVPVSDDLKIRNPQSGQLSVNHVARPARDAAKVDLAAIAPKDPKPTKVKGKGKETAAAAVAPQETSAADLYVLQITEGHGKSKKVKDTDPKSKAGALDALNMFVDKWIERGATVERMATQTKITTPGGQTRVYKIIRAK